MQGRSVTLVTPTVTEYNVMDEIDYILVDTSSGDNITINLTGIRQDSYRKDLVITDIGGNASVGLINIVPAGSNTINGQGALQLNVDHISAELKVISKDDFFANLSTDSNDIVAFGTGLTNTGGTITSDLSTGKATGQVAYGGTAASEALTLSSTINATKGKIKLGAAGASVYDEANDLLGLGIETPVCKLDINGFSRLGNEADCPAVKIIKLRGTTAAAEGGSSTLAHGLTLASIISVNVLVLDTNGNYIPPSHTGIVGVEYNVNLDATNINIFNHATNSEDILSANFIATIIHEIILPA